MTKKAPLEMWIEKNRREVVIVIVVLALIGAYVWQKDLGGSGSATLAEGIHECMENEGNERARCYDEHFSEYLEDHEVAALLEEYGAITAASPEARKDCHQIAHAMGRATYQRLQNLTDVFNLERDVETCAGGFFHGAVERLFRGDETSDEHITEEELYAKVPTLCAEFDKSGRRDECVHGIGHGALFLLVELEAALDLCEALPEKSDHFSCFSGVFMEYTMSGFSLKKNDTDTQFPCDAFKEPYRSPCYYVHSFRLSALGLSPREIISACRETQDFAGALCVRGYGIFYLAHEALEAGYEPVVQFCTSLARPDSRICAEAVASRLVDFSESAEQAFPFCAQFADSYLKGRCFAYAADVLRLGHKMEKPRIEEECLRLVPEESLCAEAI
jgi:hypothetical protein